MTIEGFEPRPKASQTVAAAKRAALPIDDDAPLPPRRAPQTQQQLIVGIVGVLAVVGVIALAISQHGGLQRATPLAITPLAQAFDTASKTSATSSPEARTATEVPTQVVRAINAYAAPDGLLLGQIAADRAITPVAHYGSDWVAYQDGTGLVWLRASDRPDLALAGPDLAPVVAQTGRGLPNDWTPPEATPVPLLSQQQLDASAASMEQNALDTALNGLSPTEQAALVQEAEQNIRRMLVPTVTR